MIRPPKLLIIPSLHAMPYVLHVVTQSELGADEEMKEDAS